MKEMIKLAFLMFAMCCFSSCEQQADEREIQEATIISSYVNDFGYKVFVISDGTMAEIIINDKTYRDQVRFLDQDYREFSYMSRISSNEQVFLKWLNAEVGGQAVLKEKKHGIKYYDIKISPDTIIERKIARVTKYDGNLNRIDGSLKLSGGLLCGTSGTGNISEEGMGSQNMFINIYFEDRDPITVNAKENQLWLDVEAGMTVIEKRINGRTSFAPKF